jgi:SAM-dependent methyltransferase
VLAQNREERERLRAALPETAGESEFWSHYLKRFAILERADDYRSYLDLLGALLGEFSAGCRVLDAGCGNGMFGLWLWLRTLRERDPHAPLPAAYVGVDLTSSGLGDALQRHAANLWAEGVGEDPGPGARPLEYSYLRMDFDTLRPEENGAALPFADATFDKVCCSLVLSYLARPDRLLQELHRVLRPGGVLVVSSMKPYCDLSAIYRDFIGQQVTGEEVERARGLLRAAGQIKLKEEKGNYTFYLSQELADLAQRAGFGEVKSHSSLGNQANVVRLVRP